MLIRYILQSIGTGGHYNADDIHHDNWYPGNWLYVADEATIFDNAEAIYKEFMCLEEDEVMEVFSGCRVIPVISIPLHEKVALNPQLTMLAFQVVKKRE